MINKDINGNKKAINKKNKDYLQKTRDKLKEYLLNHPCVDCGNKDFRVLEFDHLQNKKMSVATASQRSWAITVKEIKKCQVVCANCHKIRTYTRSNSWRIR